MKIQFRVFDASGNDVTDSKAWFVDTEGTLYFATGDEDYPLELAAYHGFSYKAM